MDTPIYKGKLGRSAQQDHASPETPASHRRSTAMVGAVSGVQRCLRPLPSQRTFAVTPSVMSRRPESDQFGDP